jgi:bifunctional DNA-binding transcriptional regulator/antitoxin component of YhaV-PrlF toxin-antitoxin module
MTVAIKNNNKTPLVVPPAVRRRAGFKSGQELEIKASGGVITILPKLPASDDEYTPQERRTIDRGIVASEKDYKEGRSYGPFKTHEKFIASLHQEAGKLRKKK